MIYQPFSYQQFATQHILSNQVNDTPNAGLLLQMGLGKTVSTLTAVSELLSRGEVKRVLVIAPKRVTESVWPAEVEKWDHLRHLRVSVVLGTEKKRKAALLAKADIFAINCENVSWLIAHYGGAFPFDMLIVDESSKFKNPKSARFRALRMVLPKIKRVVILTGSPRPHSYLDLWSQLYLLDRGTRLGKKYTEYRDRFFEAGARKGDVIFDYNLKSDKREVAEILGDDIYEKTISEKIGDICISMRTRDYIDLPPRFDRNAEVVLPAEILRQYREFETSRVLELAESGEEITALNSSAIVMKLMQFANGAVYTEADKYVEVHNEKLEAIAELIEMATSPVLVFYAFRHDLDRLTRFLKVFKPRLLKGNADITDWNRGKVNVMLAHPASAGHGLNLQDGGYNLMWFGCPVPRSLELYEQGVARVDRMGQQFSVINQRLICRGTVDEEAFAGLDEKADLQDWFMQSIRAKVEQLRS